MKYHLYTKNHPQDKHFPYFWTGSGFERTGIPEPLSEDSARDIIMEDRENHSGFRDEDYKLVPVLPEGRMI